MENFDWSKELPAAVTLTDSAGNIIYMNNKSAETFADSGGRGLIGKNMNDCHNENSNRIIQSIMIEHKPNIYTIEKKGIKKLIFQAPYFKEGALAGLCEISVVLPEGMPHFNRDKEE